MMRQWSALTGPQATAIYALLVEYAGANPSARDDFVAVQTDRHIGEYRFGGSLGFGGKFWRRHVPGGREQWAVTCYPEDQTPARTSTIAETNRVLSLLAAELGGPAAP